MVKRVKDYNTGGAIMVGCVILGFGLGSWFGHGIAGLISGIGVGFIAMALYTKK